MGEVVSSVRWLVAETTLADLSKVMAEEFQMNHRRWSRDQAHKHFKQRQALLVVRNLLSDRETRSNGEYRDQH